VNGDSLLTDFFVLEYRWCDFIQW